MNTVMNAKDAVYGSLAECFVTIGDNRYNFMSLTEFESQWEVNVTEVPILGKVGMGHKAAGGKGTWSGTAHYNQSIFRKIADAYQKTGCSFYTAPPFSTVPCFSSDSLPRCSAAAGPPCPGAVTNRACGQNAGKTRLS